MAEGDGAARDARVRAQYEAHPYPARDPADERRRLIIGSPSHILEIEHYVYAGRRAPALRALVAGGGTGDGAIMLAQQLADRGEGRVTYIDASSASLKVARARAEVRGLANIDFIQGSLLDVAELAAGPYDYIDCCGVLHHLEDPAAGLAALTAVLAPDGGMGLMLYGTLGRTGVYPMQRAIRRLADGESDGLRLTLARRLLGDLPETNWFGRNPLLADHVQGGDAGLYDLLLHSRDRAYVIPEIVELTEGAGLRISGLLPPAQYDPALYLRDEELIARARALPDLEQAALAEELSGAMKTHVFYVVRADNSAGGRADGFDAGTVPVLRELEPGPFADSLARSPRLKAAVSGVEFAHPVPAGAADIVRLIDGKLSLRQIHGRLRAKGDGSSWQEFEARFRAVVDLLQPLNVLLFAGRVDKS
jgi:ubiquinone/menaquinone biosynthesis C-methylase UbiE